jgi:hypothetical protein
VRAFGTVVPRTFELEFGVAKPSGESKREKTRTEGEIFQEVKGMCAQFLSALTVKVRFCRSTAPLHAGLEPTVPAGDHSFSNGEDIQEAQNLRTAPSQTPEFLAKVSVFRRHLAAKNRFR